MNYVKKVKRRYARSSELHVCWGAAGKLDNLHRDTEVLCCKGLSFRDLES